MALSQEYRRTVVLHAADRGDNVMMGKLLARVEFADPATKELVLREALFLAVHGEHPDLVKSLLKAGATDACLFQLAFRTDRRQVLDIPDVVGAYALEFACTNVEGFVDVVRMLVDAGADIHTSYDMALEYAVFNYKADMTKLLLDLGADIHITRDGHTLLGFMRKWMHLTGDESREAQQRTIDVLVAAGAPESL
ncbi:hypothetical protein HDV00_004360 [Rhizophlyctis rosea]|nr:hypothetical protein HDV00_004360 [Rhizophlyctis rosea]